jgi:cell division protein FtsI/penicillin-binding protein 2
MGLGYQHRESVRHVVRSLRRQGLSKDLLAKFFGGSGNVQKFPAELELPVDGDVIKGKIEYTFDTELQEAMESAFRTYRPDYGAFVAIDPATGRVLSMVSYSLEGDLKENLALRATFPSASVFKVVTASAAIAEGKLSANSVISFNGRNHTLYRQNILKDKLTRWTRYMTMKEAFARSVNTVFGKIGAFSVGPTTMRAYADRFGFDRQIASDVPVQEGHAPISDDPWKLAETASGYTRENTMSPLQGALIAAAIANDGLMMEPFVVQSVRSADGLDLYRGVPKVSMQTVDAGTASQLRELMRQTVVRGTSTRSFKRFFRGQLANLEVGGKTGSLTGMDPQGKYDWFVGYGRTGVPGRPAIAVAALTVHKKFWRVKSSYVARMAMEKYFKKAAFPKNVASEP